MKQFKYRQKMNSFDIYNQLIVLKRMEQIGHQQQHLRKLLLQIFSPQIQIILNVHLHNKMMAMDIIVVHQ